VSRIKDLTNQIFGRLTVLRYIGNDKYNTAIWECRCECGVIKNINGGALRSGMTKSCRCLHIESARKQGQASIINMVGYKYGRLTVLRKVDKKESRDIYWECLCECGNSNYIVKGAHLRSGVIKSCGCLRKELTSKRMKKYNTYDLDGEYGVGYDSKGNEFYFDLEDKDKISEYCWWMHSGYAVTTINNKSIRMHRFILNLDDDELLQVDHINQIKHDNRKENLRLVTGQQNTWNTGLRVTNTSGVKGVYYNKKKDKWFAKIVCNYKQIHLGFFDNKEDAIKARKEGEEFYFGEYNPINNP
jgi:hypothetical protein